VVEHRGIRVGGGGVDPSSLFINENFKKYMHEKWRQVVHKRKSRLSISFSKAAEATRFLKYIDFCPFFRIMPA
jgi:hypothetical protein